MNNQKPKGTLIKVFVNDKNENSGTELVYIYRDEQGNKQCKFVGKPVLPYAIAKPGVKLNNFVLKNDVTYYEAPADTLIHHIAEALGPQALKYRDRIRMLYGNNIREMENKMQNIHKIPGVYDSDMSVEDRYHNNFYKMFDPNPEYQLKKAFYDIETDLMPDGVTKRLEGINTSDPQDPVALISIYYEGEMYVLLYDYGTKNDSFSSFVRRLNSPGYKESLIKKCLDRNNPIDSKKQRAPIILEDVKVEMFADEYLLVRRFFDLMHQLDPDFAEAWNASFDIQTLVNRLPKLEVIYRKKHLGEKIKLSEARNICRSYIADEKYYKYFSTLPNHFYKEDKSEEGYVDPSKKVEYFMVCDGIQWLDQMVAFATHSAGGKRDSWTLNAIAEEELDLHKLSLHDEEVDIYNAIWKRYELFFEYNLQDTLLLVGIENLYKTAELIQSISEITMSPHRYNASQSKYLKNLCNTFANNFGYVMCNNINMKYETFNDPVCAETAYFNKVFRPGFSHYIEENERSMKAELKRILLKKDGYGGIVGNPKKNTNKNGDFIFGMRSFFLYSYIFDLDFSSLYPSIIISHNIDSSTLKSQLFLVDNHIFNKFQNRGYNGVYLLSNTTKDYWPDDPSKKTKVKHIEDDPNLAVYLVDLLHSTDYDELGQMFYDLPSTEDMINELNGMVS